MSSIERVQEQIIEEFELFEEWDEKYGYIIEMGKKLPSMPEKYKVQENIIKGCQSTVWLASEYKDGRVKFFAESDALIVKGLVSLLIKVYSEQSPKEIVETEPYFIEKIGMKQHLSMTRSNGLSSMVKQMKIEALVYIHQN